MRIIYAGGGQRGRVCLKGILKEFNLVAVIEDAKVDEKDSMKDIATHNGIPLLKVGNINSKVSIKKIKSFKPDVLVLSGFTQIIKKQIVDIMKLKKGIINTHGGKLPEYRGGSPLNWQIINGERSITLSVIFIDEGLDTGTILSEESFNIGKDTTIKDVYDISNELFPKILIKSLNSILDNKLKPKKQSESNVRYFGSRKPEDGVIDWKNQTAFEIHGRIRALTLPLPGAFTYYKGKKLLIWKSKLPQSVYMHEKGKLFLKREGGVVVMAKDKGLILLEVQEEEKEKCLAKDYFEHMGDYLG